MAGLVPAIHDFAAARCAFGLVECPGPDIHEFRAHIRDRPPTLKGLLKFLRGPILKLMLNQSAPLDLMFQALADPTRRAMVERLSHGPASVSDLAKPFAMSLPAVMQHLAVLESAGLVVTEKIGRVRTCRIDPDALGRAGGWISARRTEWEKRLDRLGDYLETLKSEGEDDGRQD